MKDIEIIVLLMFIAQSLYTLFLMRQIMTLEKIITGMIFGRVEETDEDDGDFY